MREIMCTCTGSECEIMCTCTGSMREIMCTCTGSECEGDHVYLHRE